jgi:hypothetical protein
VREDDPPDGEAAFRLRWASDRVEVVHGLPILPQVRGKLVELGIVAGQESNRAGLEGEPHWDRAEFTNESSRLDRSVSALRPFCAD